MDNELVKKRINQLILEHKDLHDTINLMNAQAYKDELQIRRLKTRKLKVKDEMEILESKLIPDIEA